MAMHEIITEGDADVTPVSCTLTSADLAAVTGRWEQLAARAMTERAETADGLRICFRPEPGAGEELRRLAAVENECCPWAEWTVETSAEQVVLEIRSAGAGIGALHSMFTGLQPAPAARRS
jgi:hypothetical protein